MRMHAIRNACLAGAAFAALAMPARAGCILDEAPSDLAARLTIAAPKISVLTSQIFDALALAEMAVPGAAAALSQVPEGLGEDRGTLEAAIPIAQALAQGEVETAVAAMERIEDDGTRKDILNAIVRLTGQYDLLARYYPIGDSVYSQNLWSDTPTQMLIEADRPQDAVALFGRFEIANHSDRKLSTVLRAFLDRGYRNEAAQLLDQTSLALESVAGDTNAKGHHDRIRAVILGGWAAIGEPRPDDMPTSTFIDASFEVREAHAAVMAALTNTGQGSALAVFLQRQRNLSSLGSSVLRTTWSLDPFADEDMAKAFAVADARFLALNGAFDLLAAIAVAPETREWARVTAAQALIRKALQDKDVARVAGWFPVAGENAFWLSGAAAQAGLQDDPDILALIDAAWRRSFCTGEAEINPRDTLFVARHLLARAAVRQGRVPASILRH